MTTLYNTIALLWTFIKNPSWIAVIMAVIDLVGSGGFQSLMDAIGEALEKEASPAIPDTEAAKARLLDRIRTRLGLAWLGLSESDYAAVCGFKDLPGTTGSKNTDINA